MSRKIKQRAKKFDPSKLKNYIPTTRIKRRIPDYAFSYMGVRIDPIDLFNRSLNI